MNKVKIWLIWAWDHMSHHVSWFEWLENFEIVAICDPNRDAVDKILWLKNIQAKNVSIFLNSTDMYKNSSFDAVMSATPDRFHLWDIKDAVNNKKHIMMEKPLVSTSSELGELVDLLKASREENLIISSCHPRRFDFPQLWLKEMMPQLLDELWKVVTFFYDFSYTTLKRRWIHEWLLVDHFNHEIDLLNFLYWFSNFKANKLFDTEDRYEASWIREDGIAFHFSWTRFLDASTRNYPEFMKIRLEKWEVLVETKTWYVQIHNHETWIKKESIISQTDYVERLRRVNSNFINSILWTEEPYLRLEDMLLNTSSSLTLSKNWEYNSKTDTYLESLRKVDEWYFWDSKWELIKSKTLPNESDTTAAISLIIDWNGHIFLTKNKDFKKGRWWDLPWGHIESWESIEEAWRRELYEEAWIKAKNYKLAWYIKITSNHKIPKKEGWFYPNPWYMAFYTWNIDGIIEKPIWEEIELSSSFPIEEALNILWSCMDKSAIKKLLCE